MATVIDCADPVAVLPGMREARGAIARGELVVIPTDTVYGVAADAFDPSAVQRLLDAKGRGRQAPPPVLVPTMGTLAALAEVVPPAVQELAEAFWPGPLTIILPARASLAWDLGETNGTVALRMPDQRIALELLAETGPLAVSSANRTGEPAATDILEAQAQLGESIAVYLDDGDSPGAQPSTIVDATALAAGTGPLRIVRRGALPEAAIRQVVPEAFDEVQRPAQQFDAADDVEPDTETEAESSANAAATVSETDAGDLPDSSPRP